MCLVDKYVQPGSRVSGNRNYSVFITDNYIQRGNHVSGYRNYPTCLIENYIQQGSPVSGYGIYPASLVDWVQILHETIIVILERRHGCKMATCMATCGTRFWQLV